MNHAQHTASGLPWVRRHDDARAVLAMAQHYGISEPLANILVGRGVGPDDVETFLGRKTEDGFEGPKLRDLLPDPFHLRDMDKAVARIVQAIDAHEPIAVFGDYDVDGATSSALLVRYFAALGIPIATYIPDRMKEGYGPSVAGFSKLIEGTVIAAAIPSPLQGGLGRGASESAEPKLRPPTQPSPARGEGFSGAKLIITVDCGTLAHAPISYAKSRGVDVIVLDHHASDGALPEAVAVVNPNRLDETSPHRNLAAVGVTFLVLVALSKTLREAGAFKSRESRVESSVSDKNPTGLWILDSGLSEPNLLAFLDLVALGTVCDVMTLSGLNRALVAQGLKVMAQRRNLGLAILADIARMTEAPNVYHLGFLLGPRINAGGRVGASGLGVELLITSDPDRARPIAATLDRHNAERQAIEAGVLDAALAAAVSQENMPVMLIVGEGWHPGVIGIVAGRLKEKYNRPVAVAAMENGVAKASARSVEGADFGAAVHAAQASGHITHGGGHAMAAGFSFEARQQQALHAFLIDRLGPAVTAYQDARVQRFDATLSVAGATREAIADMALAGPFGMGNPGPRLVIAGARIAHRQVLKDKHVKLVLSDDSGKTRLEAIAFNAVDQPLGAMLMRAQTLDLLGKLELNHWQGRETPQFLIDDAADAR